MKKILLLVLLSVIVFSCNNPENKKSNKTATLQLGVMSSMDYLPLAVAQREGYFEKAGLDIKLHKFYSANERDAAFQSKNIDGCVIDFTGAVLQKAGGIDLKLTSKCDAPFYIIVGKNTNINNPEDLKGKQVAVSQNTVIDFIVDMALKSAGLTGTDIKKVEINKIPVRFEMLRNEKIDATGLPNPFALMAEKEGDKIITSNDDLGFAITGIIFHQKAIDEKSDLIKKMYEAYNMGVEYLQNHTPLDIKDILVKDFGFPSDLVTDKLAYRYTSAQLPAEKDIEATVEWLKERSLIKSDFNHATVLDSQFIQ